ncbi:39S ribosomal protein L55, mitochondrial isoform X2 [Erpetoichthys calabaricus]|uniref:Zgc:171480 n=1 Tax=Erpetoichthys calabaricus TaxID=27687 RepID=A0A8C4X9C5_ERPCA|nr:39S ribosomal protein L55, mitochondrial isoform X2 [Erpetoichthys calabaricus]
MAAQRLLSAAKSTGRFLQNNDLFRHFPGTCSFHDSMATCGSNRTSIVRCGRQTYARFYPVVLVRADGSTVNMRYKEPKRIIMMPLDISTLSEADRKATLRRRELRKGAAKPEKPEYEDEFKIDDYSKFWKKK